MKTLYYLLPTFEDHEEPEKGLLQTEHFRKKIRKRINKLYDTRAYKKIGYDILEYDILSMAIKADIIVVINLFGYDGYDMPGIIKLREVCRKNGIELIERY